MVRRSMLLVLCALCWAQSDSKPAPTHSNVAYGSHERNVLDFWKARSEAPTPLVIFIHGGGFRNGSKENLNARALGQLLASGISVAAINYRLVPANPLPAAHDDARRALQFLRFKAAEWGIDKKKVGAMGGSAGAQLCMYLGFHDEMARAASKDPVERESTRLAYVATTGGQTTMDLAWWTANIPGYTSAHRELKELVGGASPEQIDRLVREISALSLISKDDPPIHMTYAMAPGDAPPDTAKVQGWRVHHVNFGIALKKKMDALGVEADLNYPGGNARYASAPEFFRAKFAGK